VTIGLNEKMFLDMHKLRVGIIDDELHSCETLIFDLTEWFGNTIDILFSVTDPFEGVRFVRELIPDILFVDLFMPGLSGFDVIKLTDDLNTQIIAMSDYLECEDFAEKNALQTFLPKPIQLNDIKCIFKQSLIMSKQFDASLFI
jgi:CheY-like chemotaxis protein